MFNKKKIILFVIAFFIISLNAAFAAPLTECKEYTKLGIPGKDGELLCRKGYLLAHSSVNKTSIWVIEHLTAKKAQGTIKRNGKFKPDPDLEVGERAELADYKTASSIYDRGHMAPAADMKWDQQAMNECFYLSNMVPQDKKNNEVIWRILEEKVRRWAIEREEIYIFTGPIYADKKKETIGDNEVAVPTHIYKIVYDPVGAEAIAFILPNKELDPKDLPSFIVTIRDVEDKTGLNFLSKVNKHAQDAIETKKAEDLW
jgi:endonuclease G